MKEKLKLGQLVRVCSGVGMHAWYYSKIGLVRKPVGAMSDSKKWTSVFRYTLWERIVVYIKRILNKIIK